MSAQGSVLSLAAGRAWPSRIERIGCVLRQTGVRLEAAAPRLAARPLGDRDPTYPRLRLLP